MASKPADQGFREHLTRALEHWRGTHQDGGRSRGARLESLLEDTKRLLDALEASEEASRPVGLLEHTKTARLRVEHQVRRFEGGSSPKALVRKLSEQMATEPSGGTPEERLVDILERLFQEITDRNAKLFPGDHKDLSQKGDSLPVRAIQRLSEDLARAGAEIRDGRHPQTTDDETQLQKVSDRLSQIAGELPAWLADIRTRYESVLASLQGAAAESLTTLSPEAAIQVAAELADRGPAVFGELLESLPRQGRARLLRDLVTDGRALPTLLDHQVAIREWPTDVRTYPTVLAPGLLEEEAAKLRKEATFVGYRHLGHDLACEDREKSTPGEVFSDQELLMAVLDHVERRPEDVMRLIGPSSRQDHQWTWAQGKLAWATHEDGADSGRADVRRLKDILGRLPSVMDERCPEELPAYAYRVTARSRDGHAAPDWIAKGVSPDHLIRGFEALSVEADKGREVNEETRAKWEMARDMAIEVIFAGHGKRRLMPHWKDVAPTEVIRAATRFLLRELALGIRRGEWDGAIPAESFAEKEIRRILTAAGHGLEMTGEVAFEPTDIEDLLTAKPSEVRSFAVEELVPRMADPAEERTEIQASVPAEGERRGDRSAKRERSRGGP